MHIPDFENEKKLKKDGYDFVIGIDEAGRGPLAGPVVAAAVVLRNDSIERVDENWNLIRDSKTLSEKQREKAFDLIMENFYIGTGICDQNTIDRINILEATYLAMKKAFVNLKPKLEDSNLKNIILVDGNKNIPNLSEEQKSVVQGDKKIKSISAASIIAKVTRDRMMKEFGEKYPEYGFEKHKGYGTKMHMKTLVEHGPCEIHRKSFAPVKRSLQN